MPDNGVIARFVGTLRSALHPARTAPALSRPQIRPPITFFLWTVLPLGLLSGIIPYTQTLHFDGLFAMQVHKGTSAEMIVVDIARAMGLSLLVHLVSLGAVTIPFVSLARAYGTVRATQGATRLMLYRGFLLLLSFPVAPVRDVALPSVYHVLFWATPKEWGLVVWSLHVFVTLIPLLLLFVAMRSTARMVHGVGPFASLVVVLVPMILLWVVQPVILEVLKPFLPVLPIETALTTTVS